MKGVGDRIRRLRSDALSLNWKKKVLYKRTYPSGQSKLSSGLTSGTSDFEMKLPSTYTLACPLKKVYGEAFLIFAYQYTIRHSIKKINNPFS